MAMKRPKMPEKPQRPRGTGSISVVWEPGCRAWRFKARFGTIPAGTHASADDAHAALNALVGAASGGITVRAGESLYDYGYKRIERWRDRNKKNWLSTWRSTVQRAPFAHEALDTITRSDVRDWVLGLLEVISERTGKPISWQTAKHALGLVRRVFDDAGPDGDGVVLENPAEKVSMPSDDSAEDGWDYLRWPELIAMLRNPLLPPKQRSAFAFAVMAGPREGEMCGLDWPRLDLFSSRPHARIAASWDLQTTKSNRARNVPILPQLLPFLLDWWEECGRPDKGPVWPSKRGGRHAKGYDFGWSDTMDLKWRQTCFLGYRRRLGIQRNVRFHDLRHTCGSHLAMGSFGRRWFSPEIRDFLGHTDEETTQRYVHIADEALSAAAAATSCLELVREDSTGIALAREFIGKMGARDAGFEPATSGSGGPWTTSSSDALALPGQEPDKTEISRTRMLLLVAQIARGEWVDQADVEPIAMATVERARRLAKLAGDVLSADETNRRSRSLLLLEALLDELRVSAKGSVAQ